MAKLYTYKTVNISLLLMFYATQLQAQPSSVASNNLLFKIIFISVIFALIHLPFLMLSFFYAVNGHKFNEKERKDRLFALSVAGFLNFVLLLGCFFKWYFFWPILVAIAIPVVYIVVAHFYGYRPVLSWLISMVYIFNCYIFMSGGIGNPDGFGSKNGAYQTYYPKSGKLLSRINYKNGLKDGVCLRYHENGQLAAEFNYENDLLEGAAKEYYDNGHLKSSYYLKNNAVEGQYLSFYRNKKTESKRKFKNGLLEGIEKIYYENGELSSLFNYKNGKKHGVCKEYFPNGKLKSTCIYSDEPQDCSTYYSNGLLKEKGFCRGMQKVGLWEAFHTNGNLSETGYYTLSEYSNSLKHGLWKSYHSNGKLETIGEYAKGIRHGPWKKYFSDGSLSDSKVY